MTGHLSGLVALQRGQEGSGGPGISRGNTEPSGTYCSGGGDWEQESVCQEALSLLYF